MTNEQEQKLKDNFDEGNITDVKELVGREEKIPEMLGLFFDESENGNPIKVSKESRKISAESVLD